jgi:hypothetical protein
MLVDSDLDHGARRKSEESSGDEFPYLSCVDGCLFVKDTVMNDCQLLDQFAADGSDESFSVIIERSGGLVYHTALRQPGNPDIVEEAAQAVFIAPAQKARKIPRNTVLSGCLFRAARSAERLPWVQANGETPLAFPFRKSFPEPSRPTRTMKRRCLPLILPLSMLEEAIMVTFIGAAKGVISENSGRPKLARRTRSH